MASSKGNAYLLPLFPAASLLVAILWRDFIETPSLGLRKGFIYSFLPLILPLVVGLVYLLVNPPTMVEEKYGVDLMKMTLLGFIIMATQAFAFIALLKRHYRVSFGFTSGLMIAASLVFTVWVAPLINPFKSTIRLAQKYDTLAAPGGKMVFFGRIKDSALFYSDRKAVRIVDNGKLIEYLRSNPKALVIMHKRDLERVELLKRISYVIDSEGNHLLVATRK